MKILSVGIVRARDDSCNNALSRRGLLTATFAVNVPAYDIVATGSRGQTALVQVKAIAGPSWPFDIRTFVDVR